MPPSPRQVSAPAPAPRSAAEEASPKHVYGQGRQKLLAAVASLVAREGSARITLRDLAKEAGMSHNAIYRHFSGVDDMLEELVRDHNQRLREGLRQARAQVPAGEASSRTVVTWLFAFALANREAFVVAIRERHGLSRAAREAIEQGLADILDDMRSDLMASQHLPALPIATLDIALRVIIQHTFELCLACIDDPDRRPALLAEAEQVFRWCLSGAVADVEAAKRPAPARR
jgi:TetR/AcrR family transcriptional regulator, fatty acid biosynthesis regulator